ncbi:mono/diheme cytochrome c family protein [Bosea sp. BE125]|uniref:c-type cytochrome n=1 Tax=Bosea sp. BE125 TaxID=2817909 RepID=UPI002860F10A|nr:cytochrome c [Bosea sp. BE125]MDR6874915.1 mono/diheme cytochrome c family protein [Bosea sp. BE125]
MTAIRTRRQRPMMTSHGRWGSFALCAALFGAAPALAEGIGDARAGREIATSLCSQCHQIDGSGRDSSRVPPGFGAVADMASQTELSLRVFLQTPHGNMPRYQLTRDETEDVIAYILSLRAR